MGSSIDIALEIERLLMFAVQKKFVQQKDVVYYRNKLIDFLKATAGPKEDVPQLEFKDSDDIRNNILSYCYDNGFIPDATVAQRDNFAAKIMGLITPLPSVVERNFFSHLASSPIDATDYLFNLSLDLNYIHRQRMKKNFNFHHEEPYGQLDLSINFAKPDKTKEELEKMAEEPLSSYPKCVLCAENVGFAGNLHMPAKQNLRTVPLKLADKNWLFLYSPYMHYNEHCLVVSEKHERAEIGETTFAVMCDFVDMFPHYFLASGGDLPGVGDSLLEHTHFQGGCNMFPIEYADTSQRFTHPLYPTVTFKTMNWPVSTLRLECKDKEEIIEAIEYVRKSWSDYSDDSLNLRAYTEENGEKVQHNTIISVMRKSLLSNYEIDIFFRNNDVSEEKPNGIFNIPDDVKHIKDEPVGILECLGLAVFPGKFDYELIYCVQHLMTGQDSKKIRPEIEKHSEWVDSLVQKYGAIKDYEQCRDVITFEVGKKYAKIMDSVGIFKLTDEGRQHFCDFMENIGFIEDKAD